MRAFPFISLLPFVFLIFSIAGIVLITLAVRGRPIFAAPRCRKCGYDLRNISFASDDVGNCPECGTTLSSPDAVTFGRWRRQPKKIVWGVVFVALPWIIGLAMMFVVRNRMVTAVAGPGALPSQTTPALIAARHRQGPPAASLVWQFHLCGDGSEQRSALSDVVSAANAASTSACVNWFALSRRSSSCQCHGVFKLAGKALR